MKKRMLRIQLSEAHEANAVLTERNQNQRTTIVRLEAEIKFLADQLIALKGDLIEAEALNRALIRKIDTGG